MRASLKLTQLGLACLLVISAATVGAQTRQAAVFNGIGDAQQMAESDAIQAADSRARAAVEALLGRSAAGLDEDEQLAAVADRMPGFAGYKAMPDGSVVAMMTGDSGLLSRGGTSNWRSANTDASRFVQSLADSTDVAAVQFDARQLLTTKEAARALFDSTGAHTTWIDHDNNRVYIGHDPDLTADETQALADTLSASGVRRGTAVWVPLSRAQAQVQVGVSLQAQRQPVPGGAQFQFAGRGGNFNCTVGVPALRNGVWGFVTASHCSQTVYNPSSSTLAFAPVINNGFLGTEVADPAGTNCNTQAVLGCRQSDAMFYSVGSASRSVELGRMAFANNVNSRSLIASGTIAVSGTVGSPALNAVVYKTGRTTGTTSGRVSRRCVDTLVSTGTGATFYGNYVARCSSEINGNFSAGGDSGSAIWLLQNNAAVIGGILSYGRGGTAPSTGFSRWAGVTNELGNIAVR